MKDDYFAENISSYSHTPKKGNGGVSVATLIISMVGTAIFVLLIVAKWNNILSIFGVDEVEQTQVIDVNLSVGDDVELTGIISQDGDMVNYTHMIKSEEYGLLGLKSTKINLNNYTSEVSLEGIVEKIYQGVPIVLVDSIYAIEFEDIEDVDTGDVEKVVVQPKSLPDLDMYFDEKFFDKYVLINEGDNGVLKIKDLESSQIISISYFKCNKNSINENCDKLVENIGGLSPQKFVDGQGITYYKQSDIDSWFLTNGKFGYFINNIKDSDLKALAKMNIVNNDALVKDSKDDKNNNLTGTDSKDNDNDKKESEQDQETTQVKDEQKKTDWDPNVAQFPINLEKALTFKSSKGHTYIFPSSNLSYMGVGASENFDQAGVNCYSAMNVVKYSEKESVESYGSVVIYECNVKNGFDDSDPSLIYREVGDKDFIIKINDPAWVNFANNIVIEA